MAVGSRIAWPSVVAQAELGITYAWPGVWVGAAARTAAGERWL